MIGWILQCYKKAMVLLAMYIKWKMALGVIWILGWLWSPLLALVKHKTLWVLC